MPLAHAVAVSQHLLLLARRPDLVDLSLRQLPDWTALASLMRAVQKLVSMVVGTCVPAKIAIVIIRLIAIVVADLKLRMWLRTYPSVCHDAGDARRSMLAANRQIDLNSPVFLWELPEHVAYRIPAAPRAMGNAHNPIRADLISWIRWTRLELHDCYPIPASCMKAYITSESPSNGVQVRYMIPSVAFVLVKASM
jgi:hypothetical protein